LDAVRKIVELAMLATVEIESVTLKMKKGNRHLQYDTFLARDFVFNANNLM